MQVRVLGAIERRLASGLPAPTYRELCAEFSWASTATARDHLKALARKGAIKLSGRAHRRIQLAIPAALGSDVPLLGKVVAGAPIVSDEAVEGRIAVPEKWLGNGATFALRVHGDSMMDAGIHEGDCVVVRQQPDAAHGDIIVVTLDGKTTVKRLHRSGGVSTLIAENRSYPPIPVLTESTVIHGVVVGLIRDYQRHGSPHQVHAAGNAFVRRKTS